MKENRIVLRRAELSDVKAIFGIEFLCFSGPEVWSSGAIEGFINSPASRYILALCDGRIAAYLAINTIPPEAEIAGIACHPAYRRRGIASALLDYLISLKKSEGIDCLYLEVRNSNGPAIALYKKYGFKSCGIRKGYYNNPTEDAIIMTARL